MLHRTKSIAVRLWRDERGASLLEYTVLLGLIVAVSVTAVLALGTYTGNWFTTFKTSISDPGKLGDGTIK